MIGDRSVFEIYFVGGTAIHSRGMGFGLLRLWGRWGLCRWALVLRNWFKRLSVGEVRPRLDVQQH